MQHCLNLLDVFICPSSGSQSHMIAILIVIPMTFRPTEVTLSRSNWPPTEAFEVRPF